MVGFQLIDDGTAISLGAILVSAGAIFIATGFLTLDTAFTWTQTQGLVGSLDFPNENIPLYVLYQLLPLLCIVLFFLLETYLVLRVLGEVRPMSKFFST